MVKKLKNYHKIDFGYTAYNTYHSRVWSKNGALYALYYCDNLGAISMDVYEVN